MCWADFVRVVPGSTDFAKTEENTRHGSGQGRVVSQCYDRLTRKSIVRKTLR